MSLFPVRYKFIYVIGPGNSINEIIAIRKIDMPTVSNSESKAIIPEFIENKCLR